MNVKTAGVIKGNNLMQVKKASESQKFIPGEKQEFVLVLYDPINGTGVPLKDPEEIKRNEKCIRM